MLDNTTNQCSKFKTKNWVEINDDGSGAYNGNSKKRKKNETYNVKVKCIWL